MRVDPGRHQPSEGMIRGCWLLTPPSCCRVQAAAELKVAAEAELQLRLNTPKLAAKEQLLQKTIAAAAEGYSSCCGRL